MLVYFESSNLDLKKHFTSKIRIWIPHFDKFDILVLTKKPYQNFARKAYAQNDMQRPGQALLHR